MLSEEGQQCLQMLEASVFTVSKEHFRMYQMRDLFVTSAGRRTLAEINSLCSEYTRNHSDQG